MSRSKENYPQDLLSPANYGQGIDIVEIARIEKLLQRWGNRFTDRIYTDHENAYCKGRTASLAARFVSKEAFVKAIGTGLRSMSWRDIEILNRPSGRPYFVLHKGALLAFERGGWKSCSLTITHSAGVAVAIVTVSK